MINPNVWDINFWKKRLQNAENIGILHWTVYLVNANEWRNINNEHEKIFKSLIKDSDKVLDAGCGYGRWAYFFNDYVGVDFSPDLIEKAKELNKDKKFIIADLEKLPFKKKEFDWAFCVSIKGMIQNFESMDKWDRMEKELKRVAKHILLLEYTNPQDFTIL